MHQVVTNLLGNALKFTPAGGTVTIRTGSAAAADAVLEVADTGVGIPADELPRIFDRFWRGQAAAQTSGSGIGLAIAAELARGARRHAHRRQPAGRGDTPHPHPAARLTPSPSPHRRHSDGTMPAPPAI